MEIYEKLDAVIRKNRAWNSDDMRSHAAAMSSITGIRRDSSSGWTTQAP